MRKMANSRLAFLALHGAIVVMGCTPVDDGPRLEVAGDVCKKRHIDHVQLLAEGGMVVVCRNETGTSSTVYRFDENSHSKTMIYTEAPGFTVQKVVGEIMYISPDRFTPVPRGPAFRALRLDAGMTTPSAFVVSTLHQAASFGVSKSYAYWGWSSWQTQDLMTYGLSRAPLSGGAEEEVATLPFNPSKLALLGEDVYALGFPSRGADYHIAVAYIPAANRTATTIFSEPKGADLVSPWFGTYQDHVIWSDTTAIPPKIYEVHESTVQPDKSLRCAPDSRSVLSGDVMISWDTRKCATPEDSALIATDLVTHQTSYYPVGTMKMDSLIGARNGWIYATQRGLIVRVSLESL
jgi:hypothetical protein